MLCSTRIDGPDQVPVLTTGNRASKLRVTVQGFKGLAQREGAQQFAVGHKRHRGKVGVHAADVGFGVAIDEARLNGLDRRSCQSHRNITS